MEKVFYTAYISHNNSIICLGQIAITTHALLVSDLSGDSSQFTLTCISTGGPATTVTWTRDFNFTTVIEGTETVLFNTTTAQYIHSLNVTAEGVYMCTVANSAFSASANITLKGISFFLANTFKGNLLLVPVPPNGVTAVQDGLTSIIVTWIASGDTTGYRVSYNSREGDSGSADVSGDNHTLTGLVREATYTISIIATYPSTLISSPITVELSEADPTIIMNSLLFSNYQSHLQSRFIW